MKPRSGLLTVIFFFSSFVLAQEVAIIEVLKGSASIGNIPVRKGDKVKEGSSIVTNKASFLRLKFTDQTIVSLGPNSEFLIKSFRKVNKKRNNSLRLLKGKMRVLVNKFADEGEKIQFNSGQVSLGVRGTEFLVNTLQFGGAPSSDTLLIKGSLRASGSGFNAFTMTPGQYFNSQDIVRSGMSAVKKLSGEALNKLKDQEDLFLPDLKTPAGLTKLSQALGFGVAAGSVAGATGGALLGAAGALIPSSKKEEEKSAVALSKDDEKDKKPKKKKKKVKKRRVNTNVKGTLSFRYKLKEEKWDIRDAVMNRKKNKKNNKCFFYFYKKLPGAGEAERFRRERDCDEFEYDL